MQLIPEGFFKPKPSRPKPRQRETPSFKAGPYHGGNPYPFCDYTANAWEKFWRDVPYIGKARFFEPRWKYKNHEENDKRRKCY